MGKKLKMPAGGLASESKPVETPAVAEQAADILEAADEATVDGGDLESQLDAAYQAADATSQVSCGQPCETETCRDCAEFTVQSVAPPSEPEIADADIPPSPAMEAAADAPTPDSASLPADAPTETPPSRPVIAAEISQEQKDAYSDALRKHWKRRYDWERDVEAAKEKHTSSAIVRSQADDARKLAKKHEDDALDELMSLLNNEPKKPTFAEVIAELARKRPGAAASDRPAEQSSAPAPANTSEAWKSRPITELDLPAKLIERLQEDEIKTIGQLETRRAEISQGMAKWTKGVGTAKITLIEDAVIKWLTANRDQAVFQDLQGGSGETDQPQRNSADSAGETENQPSATPAAAVGSEEFADAINARAVELDTGVLEDFDDQLKAGYWEQGWRHYEAGGELRTCELPPSPAQDDFIRGWLAAGITTDFEASQEEPPAGEEPELQEVGAANEQSLDNGPVLFNPDDI